MEENIKNLTEKIDLLEKISLEDKTEIFSSISMKEMKELIEILKKGDNNE